ncbi:MAG: polymerase sigma-70 factor [Segetibacter sp.]|jgi:RNA polymerase sigma factor (sigma-70 family)|nr:polymerase sigma-70 factor [Segetibacter sp.]
MTEAADIAQHTQLLIEGCIKGDRFSQSRLYNLYNQKMFLVCLRYARNREEAEEILQEGFMKVFEFIHQYKFNGSFEGWMRKIMVNCALQKYRSKTHLRPVVDIDATAVADKSHDEIIATLGTKELLNMVQQLPPAYKMIFNLYVFEGMKHREIAELLGISEGTSKSNLSDARALLQKAVNKSLQSSQVKYN